MDMDTQQYQLGYQPQRWRLQHQQLESQQQQEKLSIFRQPPEQVKTNEQKMGLFTPLHLFAMRFCRNYLWGYSIQLWSPVLHSILAVA
jgi:hypothetical protein